MAEGMEVVMVVGMDATVMFVMMRVGMQMELVVVMVVGRR